MLPPKKKKKPNVIYTTTKGLTKIRHHFTKPARNPRAPKTPKVPHFPMPKGGHRNDWILKQLKRRLAAAARRKPWWWKWMISVYHKLIYFNFNPWGPLLKWGTRMGRVLEIAAYPCQTTPQIWVKAFFTALPTLLLTPIEPSAIDYMIIRIGLGHGKRRRKFLDVWDFEQLAQVKKAGVSWWVFEGAKYGAMALWYIAIADGITGFAVNWESAIYQYTGCKFPGEAFVVCDAPVGASYTAGSSGQYVNLWRLKEAHLFGGGGIYILCPSGYDPTVMFSIDYAPHPAFPGVPCSASFSLIEVGSGKVIAAPETMGNPAQGGHSAAHVTSDGLGTGIRKYAVLVSGVTGYPQVTGGNFSAYGRPGHDNIGPVEFHPRKEKPQVIKHIHGA